MNTIVNIGFANGVFTNFTMTLPAGFSDEDVVEHAQVSYLDTVGADLADSSQPHLMTIVYEDRLITHRGNRK